MSYERLIREHDGIAKLLARIEDIAQADRQQTTQVVNLLDELNAAITTHLHNEDALFVTQLINTAPGSKRYAPAEFIDNLTILRQDLRDYLYEWNPECVTLDWPGFCEETVAMTARVKTRVAAETELLYPLALKLGKIALRDRH